MTLLKTVDVAVPVSTAYNQWTQLEEFPRFMDGVESVQQIDDTRSRWKTNVMGAEREFETRITEQIPDERIAWTTTNGETEQAGVVTFHRLDEAQTRLTLQMDIEGGMLEKLGLATGVIGRQIDGDLGRFKEFIEQRGAETGGWRGEVERPKP
ncbi:SRPBCC family protein [Sporichthya brevicatena]|uniref:SRPBCC family protein n=1 Tax=Sporichthya brevicatena TaxID=171442 RepID=A0ABN1GWE2_9ACTN